jgi:hypothetical protein
MKGCQKAGRVRRSRRKQISKGKAPRHVQGTFVYETRYSLYISLSLHVYESHCQTFVVRSRNPISSSVISIYLWSELTYRHKNPISRCPLADVLCSACGMPPLCHLGLTATLHVCIYPLPYASMTPFLMGADWSVSMKEKKLGMREEALQVFPPQRRLMCFHAITISGPAS